MSSERTDVASNVKPPPPPRTPRLPLHPGCVRFDNRLRRVRLPGSLQSPLNPILIEPRCKAVYSNFFLHQLNQLMIYAKYLRTIHPLDEPFEPSKMPSSCKDIRAALAACLQESDCVMVYRNKPSDCLRPPLLESMPTKCQQLKTGYGQCKRGMVDMRKRFRGNQPIAVGQELEGGTSQGGTQLYAGRPAFGAVVKETSGNEPVERDWREVENEKFRKEG